MIDYANWDRVGIAFIPILFNPLFHQNFRHSIYTKSRQCYLWTCSYRKFIRSLAGCLAWYNYIYLTSVPLLTLLAEYVSLPSRRTLYQRSDMHPDHSLSCVMRRYRAALAGHKCPISPASSNSYSSKSEKLVPPKRYRCLCSLAGLLYCSSRTVKVFRP